MNQPASIATATCLETNKEHLDLS
jgi:hypothetical protein